MQKSIIILNDYQSRFPWDWLCLIPFDNFSQGLSKPITECSAKHFTNLISHAVFSLKVQMLRKCVIKYLPISITNQNDPIHFMFNTSQTFKKSDYSHSVWTVQQKENRRKCSLTCPLASKTRHRRPSRLMRLSPAIALWEYLNLNK